MSLHIVCFGEILWDEFPDKKIIGGAPLNVALRLNSLGNQVRMISKVGNDADGLAILDYLKKNNLNTEGVQIDNQLATGNVKVHLDTNNTATYTITEPVAWDQIMPNENDKVKTSEADAFVYGSLSSRNQQTKSTLSALLNKAKFKVFDANLRPPFYNLSFVVDLLKTADLIKLNDEELEEIANHLKFGNSSIEHHIRSLAKMTSTSHICITLGSKGAILYSNDKIYYNKGYKVTVKDTVGAGDSFLAYLIHQLLNKQPTQEALDQSCGMGAIVASKNGAIAEVSQEEIYQLLGKK